MSKTIHMICGLPRSGSTLLSNIMAQHPQVHTTPTSGCHEALFVLRNSWNQWIEHKASKELADDKNLQRVLNATLQSYHDTDKPVVIDKGRGWTSLLEMAEFALGRQAKILVPVRNISQIVASMEKLHRKSSHNKPDAGDYIDAQTVKGRANVILSNSGVLGLAYNRLKDVAQRGLADRLLLVEFDTLTSNPKETMEEVWDFLGMKSPAHDFNNHVPSNATGYPATISGYTVVYDLPAVEYLISNTNFAGATSGIQTVSASSELSASLAAWKAYDNLTTTSWLSTSLPSWNKIDFGQSEAITKIVYNVRDDSGGVQAPQDYVIAKTPLLY